MVTFSAEQEDHILQALGKDKFFYQAWLKYAQSVEDTEDVFDFIIDKRIGADYSSTYIQIADYVEKKVQDLSKAESLLRKGKDHFIKQDSLLVELKKIEKVYQEFEKRVRNDHTRIVSRMVRNIKKQKDSIRPKEN